MVMAIAIIFLKSLCSRVHIDQRISEANHIIFFLFIFFSNFLTPNAFCLQNASSCKTIQDRVLIVQGGYVSQSQGQQLSVTKKSNVLDKKPNILNSGAKKTANHDQSNNNNSTDNNDGGSTNKQEYSSPSYQAPAPAVPEVTVRFPLKFE